MAALKAEYSDRDAVIVGAVRTPVGKGKANGALHDVLAADLLAHSLREIVERTGIDPGQVDDVIAGLIAAKWGRSRAELDEFSANSHEKAARATKDGLFDNELAPIAGLSTDEIIRPGTTVDTLAGLRPAFFNEAYSARFPQINWEITPGNSSPLSDGSA